MRGPSTDNQSTEKRDRKRQPVTASGLDQGCESDHLRRDCVQDKCDPANRCVPIDLAHRLLRQGLRSRSEDDSHVPCPADPGSGKEIMTKASVGPNWQRSLIILTFTVVSVVAITVLYWAQSIFIPVALAAFLTFLLSPLVSALRQRGVARTPAVIMTVCVAALGLGDGRLGGHDSDLQPAPGTAQVQPEHQGRRQSRSRRSPPTRTGSRR